MTQLQESLRASGLTSFTYVPFCDNLGSARGDSSLLEGSDTDAILIANPDGFLCPDVMIELLVPLDDPVVGIVEARRLPIEHPKRFDQLTGRRAGLLRHAP